MKKIFGGLIVLLSYNITSGQAGSLDPSFGNQGIVRTDFGPIERAYQNDCRKILLHPDGSFYLVFEMNKQTFITHRFANGALDLSYGEGGYSVPVFLRGPTAAMQADGKIVVGGTAFVDNERFALARFNANGTLDNSFSGDGKLTTAIIDNLYRSDHLSGLIIQPDGKIVAVGNTSDNMGNDDFALVRYHTDGSTDNSFSGDGIQVTSVATTDGITDVSLQNDGKIVVTGLSNNAGIIRLTIARYLPEGILDNLFSGDGIQTVNVTSYTIGTTLSIQSDGKIVVGGYFLNNLFVQIGIVVRVNADGTLDNSFSGDGMQTIDFGGSDFFIGDLTIQNDGKILFTGFATLVGYREFYIARINVDGSPDHSFSGDGLATPNTGADPPIVPGIATSVVVQPDGRIMIAGSYQNASAFAIARYNSDGNLDLTLDGDGVLADHKASGISMHNAVAVQADGKIVTAGTSGAPSGNEAHFAVARYNIDGSLDPSFSEDGKLVVFFPRSPSEGYAIAIQPNGKIVVAGSSSNGSNTDFAVIRLNVDGSYDNSFSDDGQLTTDIRGYNDAASAVAIQPDGKIVVGGYSNIFGADDDFALVRYNADGSLDNTFSGDGKLTTDFGSSRDIGNTLIIQPDGKIVQVGIVGFTPTADNMNIAIARFNNDGSPDLSFDGDGVLITDVDGTSEFADAAVLQPDGKLVVVAGTASGNFAFVRYNNNGSFDNSFSDDGKLLFNLGALFANALVIQADGKLVAGGYSGNGFLTDFALARLNPDGTPDNSFDGDGKLIMDLGYGDDILQGMAIGGNRLYAAGRSTYGGNNSVLAAFLIDAPVSNVLRCPGNRVTNVEPGLCSAIIFNINPILNPPTTSVDYILTGATVWNGTGSVSGFRFPVGLTNVTYRLTNDVTKSCSFTLDIIDPEFPQASYPPLQKFCFNNSNNYSLPLLQATDNCGVRSIEYEISGATVRSGGGNNASGFLSPGKNFIKWTIKDISFNTTTISGEILIDQPLTVTIPLAYVLPYGVAPNTVYRGYGPGGSILLQAIPSGGDGIYAAMWSNGFPATWTMVGPGIPTTYTVTITDLSGCTATASTRINVIDVRCGEFRNKVFICIATPTGPMLICVDDWLVGNYLANGAYLLGICPSQLITSIPRSTDAKEDAGNGLHISPNPSQHEFKIRLDSENMEISDLIVRDQLGRVVEKIRIKPNQTFDIGKSYQPGIYFAEVSNGGKRFTAKLIKH